MANNSNPLTQGPDAVSGEGENSSNKRPRTFALEQQAIKRQEQAQIARDDAAKAAERRAGAAAFNAARSGIQAISTPWPQSQLSPKPKARKGK